MSSSRGNFETEHCCKIQTSNGAFNAPLDSLHVLGNDDSSAPTVAPSHVLNAGSR